MPGIFFLMFASLDLCTSQAMVGVQRHQLHIDERPGGQRQGDSRFRRR